MHEKIPLLLFDCCAKPVVHVLHVHLLHVLLLNLPDDLVGLGVDGVNVDVGHVATEPVLVADVVPAKQYFKFNLQSAVPWWWTQCDQIGYFLKVRIDKFSYKRSPNV